MPKVILWSLLAIGIFLIAGQLTKTEDDKRMSRCKSKAAEYAAELGTRQSNIDRNCGLSPYAYDALQASCKTEGRMYYWDIGSFPKLSDGRDAARVIREKCWASPWNFRKRDPSKNRHDGWTET